jgi:catechol 2,3-dioxygenase-like lactoylglutathione lyase family enzyme
MTDNTLQLRLHTIVLRVRNLKASRAWYEEKLGMRVLYTDPHYRLISLGLEGESRLTLWELREGEVPTETAKEMAYPVFLSQHARRDHRELTARGAVTEPVEDFAHGLRIFWIRDPDDHRLCVIEFLPD